MAYDVMAQSRKLGVLINCWCGSGLTYKRCHLQTDEQARRSP